MSRPSPRAFFANWNRSDLPFPERLRVAMRNSMIKVRTRKDCCGHEGEPGC
jgi:hypothetical protein